MKILACIFGLLGGGGFALSLLHNTGDSVQGIGVVALAVVMAQLSNLKDGQAELKTRVVSLEDKLSSKQKARAAHN